MSAAPRPTDLTNENPASRAGRGALPLTVALAGNPNSGKTRLFNALTGLHQKVANYPGVTVERKEGVWHLGEGAPPAILVDLPGLYSLDATSPDERIAAGSLIGGTPGLPPPDVVMVVVDATNLERNLYLVTQLLETKLPLVVALTMVDLAERAKLEVDAAKLQDALGVAVVPVTASKRRGLKEVACAVIKASGEKPPGALWRLSTFAEEEIERLSRGTASGRDVALRDLYSAELPADEARRAEVVAARGRLACVNPLWWQEPVTARYEWIAQVISDAVNGGPIDRAGRSTADKIDAIVTHKVCGPLLFLIVTMIVLQTIFTWAQLPMDLIDGTFGAVGATVRDVMPEGLLTDLIVDGVLAGVGGVFVFLPQILLLFFFMNVLEDSGYMARAVFMVDRMMRWVGLNGKAFMPLMSSFACAVPGIMATRTIESRKDRLATILIAPFMSCSARLPVYTLMIAAFFTERKVFGVVSVGVLLILAMYSIGFTVAVCVAWILKRTILKARQQTIILDLPPYRMPNLADIVQTMGWRAWIFTRRSGNVILPVSILLWALVSFPRVNTNRGSAASVSAAEVEAVAGTRTTSARSSDGGEAPIKSLQQAEGVSTVSEAVEDEGARAAVGEQIRQSFMGRLGHLLEPAIRPLGFDWQMGIGLVASFAARETLVSTLSIVYNVGDEEGEEADSLVGAVRNARRADGQPAWTPLVAVSMMVFYALACQCMSTVAVVRRETNSWRWPLFMVAYMLALAYLASLITFQGGRLLGLG